jgi:hypothetical protein
MLHMKTWHIPLRLAAGAFILQSGLSKRGTRGEDAEGLKDFATTAHPELEPLEPRQFAKALSASEIGLGSALLAPIVPSWLAGAALTAFGAGLNRLYWKAPGLRQEGDVRPTEQGMGIAKDVWLTAMGAALIVDGLRDRARAR